jgi:hypothetical protein
MSMQRRCSIDGEQAIICVQQECFLRAKSKEAMHSMLRPRSKYRVSGDPSLAYAFALSEAAYARAPHIYRQVTARFRFALGGCYAYRDTGTRAKESEVASGAGVGVVQ